MKILITADFKGLDIIMGRQLGCPTSVGIHTSLRLGDISGKGHGGKLFPDDIEKLKMITSQTLSKGPASVSCQQNDQLMSTNGRAAPL